MLGCGLLAALVITPYPWAIVLAAWPLIAVFITLDRSLRMEAQQKQLAEQNAGLAAHLAEQTEQLRIDIAERQKVEQQQSSMTAGLRAVAAVTDELIACPDVNTLFRRAVELAREKLGLERCAIFLEEGGYMRGTFGTDRYGRTTDERAQRWPVNQAWMERLEPSTPQGARWIVVQEPHREWDGQKTVQIGEGWIVITPILSAHRPIGILVNDTAISHTALDTVKQEIVATFCSSLGNITERKRAEEEIFQRNKALTALNQAGQALNKLAGPSEILHLIYTTIGLVLDNSNFYIALYDEEKQFVSFPVYSIDGNQDISGAGRPFGNGLTEYVIRTKAPLLIPHNLTETTEALGIAPIGRRAESFLAVPILVGEKVIGVIALQNYDRPDAYNTTHVELLSTFASQAAIALENARLFSLLTLEKEQLELLYRLSRQLTESLDMRTVAQRALEGVCAIVGALRGTVWVREPDPSGDSDLLLQVAVSGDNVEWAKAAAKQSVLRVGQGLAGWVAAQRQPSVVDDVTKNDQWINVPGLDDGIRATMNVPLLSGEELVGVLSLYSDQVASFDESSRRLAESIAGPVAVAMANARLFQAEREQSRRLQESQTQLIQVEKMAALGRLVASIAHEINNPLQAVQGSLTLAEEELEGRLRREKMARYLSMAEKEVERIANIVRRLRDFYRPSRQGTLPTDLHTVLASVLAMTGNQLQNNNVVVEREWADGLPLVQANPDQLKHVFLNLALNAADAMAERGGTLRVRTALDQLPTQGGKEPLPAARIEFGDTGTGIPPEILPHIFEPFVTTQPDKPTSTPDKTALGLSISYAIIQTHGGQLTVTSEVGVGTTFTILLPVSVA
jgi:signal transduction histidine kinase